MANSWKCLTCIKGYRYNGQPTRQLTCPTCGSPLVAQHQSLAPLPSPQPRAVKSRSSPTRPAPVRRHSTRPTGPEEAIALITSSSAWVPDPDPAPSPVAPDVVLPDAPKSRHSDDDPDKRSSPARPFPWIWASVGGVALTVVLFIVFITNRTGPAPASASSTPRPVAAQIIPAVAMAQAPTITTTAQPTAVPIPAAATVAARTINLLKLIDPAQDTSTGVWQLRTGEFAPELTSDASQHARLNIPYQPPEEYDFRVDFTRTAGDNCMTQIFTHQNPCCLVLFGWKGTVSGFQQVNNQSADRNPTGVRGLATANGQRHTSIVKVRKTFIEAWLDGNLVTRYDTDGADVSIKDWKIEAPLGLGTQLSPTMVHTIEITEITGQGHPLR
jgi:DNA-directed RNA polymerase subunit RPC12/RpoP